MARARPISGRHHQGVGIGRTLAVHAEDNCLLHYWLFVHFGFSWIQRIRDEVDDFISRLRNARGLVICGAAYRIGGCCRPLRHQNPLLCILRP